MDELTKRCDCTDKEKCPHKWHYDFTLDGRRYRQATKTTDRKLAGDILTRVKNDVLQDKHDITGKKGAMTLAEYRERHYLPHAKIEQRPSTLERNEDIWKSAGPVLGRLPLRAIKTDDLIRYVNRRQDRDGKSKATVNRELVHISAIITHAVENNKLGKDKRPRFPYFKKIAGRRRILTMAEVGKILGYYRQPFGRGTRGSALERYPIMLLISITGMRIGEIVKLQKADYQDGVISLWGDETKNGEPRLLYLPDELAQLIEAQVAKNPGLYIFRKPGQNPHTLATNILDHFKRVIRMLGIERPETVNLHTFRHTATTGFSSGGAAPQTVMGITGHTNMKTLQGYLHSEAHAMRTALTARHSSVMKAVEGVRPKVQQPLRKMRQSA
jgi:integrase